jgi:hypothetical protein
MANQGPNALTNGYQLIGNIGATKPKGVVYGNYNVTVRTPQGQVYPR